MTTSVAFTGVLPLLLRRKHMLMLSGVIAAGFAFVGSKALPVQYASEGSLIIDNRPTGGSESSASQTVLTEVDYLQSKGLLRNAVDLYKLDVAPDLMPRYRLPDSIKLPLANARDCLFRFWQSFNGNVARKGSAKDQVVDYIQKHVRVSAKEKSFVISISFEAGSPQTAALVANAVIGTYLKGVEGAKADRIAQADKLVGDQIVNYQQQVAAAEKGVRTYVEVHPMPQVQGSQTAALQLSEDQRQLVIARQDLARKQAAIDTVSRGSLSGSTEALDNKTIQALKGLETKYKGQYDLLAPIDPRREPLWAAMKSIQGQMANEKNLIFQSLARDVQIARAHVDALEAAITQENATAQSSTVADTSLKQLINDLEAKRQLFVAFVTKAGEARIAAIQAPTAHQLFQAMPPDRPAHTFGMLSLILGAFVGTVGASSWVVLRSMLRAKVDTAEEAAVVTGVPVIGTLPKVSRVALRKTPLHASPSMAETFRTMWLSMRPEKGNGVTILMTSSETGEGKTTIAIALAHRFAGDGFRVLLIDCDLRHPRLSSVFHHKTGRCSLQSVLSQEVALEQAVTHVQPNLECLLTNGSDNPARLLASEGFAKLLAAATSRYDFVIVDSPPILRVADTMILGKLCRYIVFVIQSGRLQGELVAEAIRRFPEEDRHKVTTLVNRVPRRRLSKGDYYTGYVSA